MSPRQTGTGTRASKTRNPPGSDSPSRSDIVSRTTGKRIRGVDNWRPGDKGKKAIAGARRARSQMVRGNKGRVQAQKRENVVRREDPTPKSQRRRVSGKKTQGQFGRQQAARKRLPGM